MAEASITSRVREWMAGHPGSHTARSIANEIGEEPERVRGCMSGLLAQRHVTKEHVGYTVLWSAVQGAKVIEHRTRPRLIGQATRARAAQVLEALKKTAAPMERKRLMVDCGLGANEFSIAVKMLVARELVQRRRTGNGTKLRTWYWITGASTREIEYDDDIAGALTAIERALYSSLNALVAPPELAHPASLRARSCLPTAPRPPIVHVLAHDQFAP